MSFGDLIIFFHSPSTVIISSRVLIVCENFFSIEAQRKTYVLAIASQD
jgi:hypothetical protein